MADRPVTDIFVKVSGAEIAGPTGVATREDIEAALQLHAAPVRFAEWNLTEATLKAIDFNGCEFVRCRAGRVDFSSCDLSNTRFVSCDLNNTNWRRATLSAALFQDCKLTGMQIADARTLGLMFERCLLVSAQIRELSFRREELEEIDFQGADLTGVDFREATLTHCNLREANVTHARFEGTDLRSSDLGNLRLADASKFKGAIISKQQAAILLGGLGLKVV